MVDVVLNKRLSDIDFGGYRSPRSPALDLLREHNTVVVPQTITHLRMNLKTGGRIAYSILCDERIKGNYSGEKDRLYLEMICQGLDLRSYCMGPRAHRFSSFHLSEGIADSQGMTVTETQLALRAMRVDLVKTAQEEGLDDEVYGAFDRSTMEYIEGDYPESTASNNIKRLKAEWRCGSVSGFYSLMYALYSRTGIGAWLPYELDVLRAFYKNRFEKGNKLSSLDRKCLERFTPSPRDSQAEELSRTTRETTGIPVDLATMSTHRNALLFGFVRNPDWMQS